MRAACFFVSMSADIVQRGDLKGFGTLSRRPVSYARRFPNRHLSLGAISISFMKITKDASYI